MRSTTLAATTLALATLSAPLLAGSCPPPRRYHHGPSYSHSYYSSGVRFGSYNDNVSFSVGFGTGYGSYYGRRSYYYPRTYCPPPYRRTVVYQPVYQQPVVREVVYREPRTVVVYKDPPATPALTWSDDLARAWAQLARGESRTARSLFAELADARPSRAEPKVGLALSALDRGDEREAVFAMRRAFEADARGAAIPSSVRDEADRLLDSLIRGANRTDCDGGTHFLIAAMAYLTGDDRTADAALEKAYGAGERGDAIDALSGLVRDASPRSTYSSDR